MGATPSAAGLFYFPVAEDSSGCMFGLDVMLQNEFGNKWKPPKWYCHKDTNLNLPETFVQ